MSEQTSTPVHANVLILKINTSQVTGDTLADALRDQFLRLYEASHARHVILDMEEVTYLSSAGIRPLLSLNKKIHEREGRLVLAGLKPDVESVLIATRLISTSRQRPTTFEAHADVPAAVSALYSA